MNYHEACRFVSERWKSFKELLKAKRQGRLTAWQEPRPPGYAKKDGHRTPTLVIRCDAYEVDTARKALHIRLGAQNRRATLSIPFKGELRWLTESATKGRLIVKYDAIKQRFYASIAVRVTIKDVAHSVPQTVHYAGIDLGIRVLATVAINNGEALLYKGGALKAHYYFLMTKIATLDNVLAKTEEMDAVLKEKRRLLYDKLRRRRQQVFTNLAAHIAKKLEEYDVAVAFVGIPKNIARNLPGTRNTNLWGYRQLIKRLAVTLENHHIALFAVDEHGSSKTCPFCGAPGERITRGLLRCPNGHLIHADVSAAANLLKRGLEMLNIDVSLPQRFHFRSYVAGPTQGRQQERQGRHPRLDDAVAPDTQGPTPLIAPRWRGNGWRGAPR